MIGGGYDLDWRYSFFFLENYKMLLMDNFPKTTPLSVFWSLCIEEHFYLIWMIAVFLIPVKRLLYFLILSIGVGLLARYFDPIIWQNSMIEQNDFFTNIDYFAIGGILGFLVAKDLNSVSNFIQKINIRWKYFYIILTLLIVIFQDYILPSNLYIFTIIRPTIIAITFTFLIAIFIPPNSSIRISNNNLISYLGKISYGLYVYHIIFVHVLFQYFLKNEILMDDWWTVTSFMALVFGGSVVASMISFRFLEQPFLKWREKF